MLQMLRQCSRAGVASPSLGASMNVDRLCDSHNLVRCANSFRSFLIELLTSHAAVDGCRGELAQQASEWMSVEDAVL